MTTKTVRLDIRDLPRDPQHFQGPLRTQLVKMANYVRKYPAKADALVETLEFTLEHIKNNIAGVKLEPKELSVAQQLTKLKGGVTKLKSKGEVVEQARKVGLELSEDQPRADINKALISKYEELIKVQETK
jgi:hypothetical protein